MGTKLLIAEDHPFLRRSIKAICQSVGFEAFEEVDTCQELLQRLRKNKYSHLVLDLTLGDGDALKILPVICHEHPILQIMVFSNRPALLYRELLKEEYGVHYYISKSEPEPETIKQLLEFIENKKSVKPARETVKGPFSVLSAREKQVLAFLLQGMSAKEISKELEISPETVRQFKMRILEKMHASDIVEVRNKYRLFNIE